MSNPGEREDAPEVEEVVDAEEQGADEPGSDEGDADALDEEPADGDVDPEQDDAAGADEGQAGAAAEVTPKPRSAATIAVQEAKRRAKEAEARAEAAERRIAEAERERQGRQTAEQVRLEQERVSLMAPEEKFEYLLNKQRQELEGRFGQLQFNQADSADRTAFEARCARIPAFDAIRDDVEAALVKARQSGGNPSRETVATYLIGQRAIERAAKGGKTKQAQRGQQNIQRQTVKTPSGRSDVQRGQQRSGGNEAQARAQRLSNMEI